MSYLLQQLGDRKEKDGEVVMRPASFRPSSAVRREDEDVTGRVYIYIYIIDDCSCCCWHFVHRQSAGDIMYFSKY